MEKLGSNDATANIITDLEAFFLNVVGREGEKAKREIVIDGCKHAFNDWKQRFASNMAVLEVQACAQVREKISSIASEHGERSPLQEDLPFQNLVNPFDTPLAVQAVGAGLVGAYGLGIAASVAGGPVGLACIGGAAVGAMIATRYSLQQDALQAALNPVVAKVLGANGCEVNKEEFLDEAATLLLRHLKSKPFQNEVTEFVISKHRGQLQELLAEFERHRFSRSSNRPEAQGAVDLQYEVDKVYKVLAMWFQEDLNRRIGADRAWLVSPPEDLAEALGIAK